MGDFRQYDDLTKTIIGCAIDVHKRLGPGLLESLYQKCLIFNLGARGIQVQSELIQPVVFKGIEIDQGYRIDLLVENTIVLELKTIEAFSEVHIAQILTYMKLGNYPIGFLLNFNVKMMKQGIKRFVL